MVVMALQKMFQLMLRCSIIRAQTSASLSLSYHLHRTLSVYQRFQRLVSPDAMMCIVGINHHSSPWSCCGALKNC
jgi:hypothetical protein